MFWDSALQAATDWFGGPSPGAAPAEVPAMLPANGNFGPTGTPSIEAANSVFGGLFGGGEDHDLRDLSRGVREQIRLDLAKDALRSKFKIGEGSGPNAVSPEEFEKIAKLYGDINAGATDLQIDPSGVDKDKRDAMRAKAMDDIATMLQTPAGRKLVGDLAHNESKDPSDPTKTIHHRTTLHLSDDKFVENDCDERGMAAARAARDREGGEAIERKATTPGQGVDAEITYHPGESKILAGPDVKATGDTTLFHEMVHAEHMTHGTKIGSSQVVNAPSSRDHGTKLEEMATVGLVPSPGNDPLLTENEYRRERAQMGEEMPQRLSYR